MRITHGHGIPTVLASAWCPSVAARHPLRHYSVHGQPARLSVLAQWIHPRTFERLRPTIPLGFSRGGRERGRGRGREKEAVDGRGGSAVVVLGQRLPGEPPGRALRAGACGVGAPRRLPGRRRRGKGTGWAWRPTRGGRIPGAHGGLPRALAESRGSGRDPQSCRQDRRSMRGSADRALPCLVRPTAGRFTWNVILGRGEDHGAPGTPCST